MQTNKLTALVATAAVAAVSGLGVAAAQDSAKGTDSSGARQAQRSHDGQRHGPGRGHRGPDAKVLADKLGVSVEKMRAALKATRPAKPSEDQRRGPGSLAADLAKALDVDAAKVKEILDANRPPRPEPGERPAGRPDVSKLVSALATGLAIDEATVKAAFDKLDADHKAKESARHTAMAAALAKELGLSTEKVQAALEAAHPHHARR